MTSPDKAQSLLPVTAEDRELAIALFEAGLLKSPLGASAPDDMVIARWRKGVLGEGDNALQIIAASRISHSLPGDVGTADLGSWEVPLPDAMSVDDAPHWANDPKFYADRFNAEVAEQRKMCDRRNEVNNHSLLYWLRGAGSYLRTIGQNAPVQGSHHHSCCIHAEQLFKIADHIEALAALTPSPCPGDGMREAVTLIKQLHAEAERAILIPSSNLPALEAAIVDMHWLIGRIVALPTPALSGDGTGWIVGNNNRTKWRMWTELGPDWTDDRGAATRYARRVDAEQVHAADEDAWRIEPYAALTPSATISDATKRMEQTLGAKFQATPSALSPEPVQKLHELPEGHRWCRHCEQKDPHCSVCEGVGYLPFALSGDAGEARDWIYDIQWGPEGQQDYAHVFDRGGNMIAVMKTHDAALVARHRGALPSHQGAGEP